MARPPRLKAKPMAGRPGGSNAEKSFGTIKIAKCQKSEIGNQRSVSEIGNQRPEVGYGNKTDKVCKRLESI